MLEIQGDAFVIGGWDGSVYQKAIYKMSCSSGICSWSTFNQDLKVARSDTVVIRVPNNFCLEGGTTTPCGGNQAWISDGFCDDFNNNINCNYDGGDCCAPNINTQYCTVIYDYIPFESITLVILFCNICRNVIAWSLLRVAVRILIIMEMAFVMIAIMYPSVTMMVEIVVDHV